MNKKAMFLYGMTHPVTMFVVGLILGLGLGYFLAMKGIFPLGIGG